MLPTTAARRTMGQMVISRPANVSTSWRGSNASASSVSTATASTMATNGRRYGPPRAGESDVIDQDPGRGMSGSRETSRVGHRAVSRIYLAFDLHDYLV